MTLKIVVLFSGSLRSHDSIRHYFKYLVCLLVYYIGIVKECWQIRRKTFDKLQWHIKEAHFPQPTTYICQYCGKSFGHRRRMVRHIKYTHLEMQHICNHCGKSYKRPTSFKLHLNRMHPNEPVAGKRKREHSTGTNAASNDI